MQTQIFSNPLTAILAVGSGVLLGGVIVILTASRPLSRWWKAGIIPDKLSALGVIFIKRLRWLWIRRDYCKHPVQLLFHLYLLAKYGLKVCFYWFLLFICLVRFGAHKCVSIYIECELAASRLTKKAEPPPTRGVNRDSGTASTNGGWLRRLVRRHL